VSPATESDGKASLTLAVYGAGGHGRVVVDAAREAGLDVVGFIDDAAPAGSTVADTRVLGGAEYLGNRAEIRVVVAVGDNRLRQSICERLVSSGIRLASVIHPTAVVSRQARVEPGAMVLALAVVGPGARVGRGAIVNSAAVVEHDAIVGEFAHVSPNATLAGAASLSRLSHLGIGASVLPGVCVAEECIVGAGAVVTRDTPPGSVCVGVPARARPARQ